MTREEFAAWSVRSKEAYAADKMRANGFTREEAQGIASESFQRHLPDGVNSKDHYLHVVLDESGGTVGSVWFSVTGPSNNRKAFIFDIIIEEAHRGRGLGRAAMLLIEKEGARLGANQVGLHVFGFNQVARSLYASLGYEITDLTLEKRI